MAENQRHATDMIIVIIIFCLYYFEEFGFRCRRVTFVSGLARSVYLSLFSGRLRKKERKERVTTLQRKRSDFSLYMNNALP